MQTNFKNYITSIKSSNYNCLKSLYIFVINESFFNELGFRCFLYFSVYSYVYIDFIRIHKH